MDTAAMSRVGRVVRPAAGATHPRRVASASPVARLARVESAERLSARVSLEPNGQHKALSMSSNSRRSCVRASFTTRASAGGGLLSDGQDSEQGSANGSNFDEMIRVPTTMAGGMGSFGGATLEKSAMTTGTVQQQTFEAKLSDGNGGGGIGKGIHNGGGGGDDDDDDDDYFEEDDDGDEDGNFWRKKLTIPEIFDRATLEAVLQEWQKTIYDLPTGMRMALEMGLVSTANLMRFLRMDQKPNVARTFARLAPANMTREVFGRMMADPAILFRLSLEQTITALTSIHYEYGQRGRRFGKELDIVAANTLSLMAANAATVWMLAPTRSFGAAHKFQWQSALASLPNNVFDKTGPLRQYTLASRAASGVVKMAQLSGIGLAIGGVNQAVVGGLHAARTSRDAEWEPEVGVPTASGMSAHLGLSASVRYQLLAGFDRYCLGTFGSLNFARGATAVARIANDRLGEPLRLKLQGMPDRVTFIESYRRKMIETRERLYAVALAQKKRQIENQLRAAGFAPEVAASSAARAVGEIQKVKKVKKIKATPEGEFSITTRQLND